MKKDEALTLVANTFTHSFSEEQFISFFRNLLPNVKIRNTDWVTGNYIKWGFQDHIKGYKRLGRFEDAKGYVLDIVIIKLKKERSLNQARSRQRNLMAHYLKTYKKDAVLAAYFVDGYNDWRFSFVKRAFQTFIDEKQKIKTKEKLTPAKRYSFLIEADHINHTVQERVVELLLNNESITVQTIEEAFNIESVTKKFFEDYKSLFLKIKENLDQILSSEQKIKNEFERCEIDTANFAKKLLGQIVFLYFLQKKGWLGVPKEQAWGNGDKKFLSNLFEKNKEINFFIEILEPFFYETLAIERKDDYYQTLECKIPFLNGGLFEPLHNYDWKNIHINLENRVFEEIFRVFNLYNFTVQEDEPLEKEVAVDPEMLGKVFENLLEVKDRKSKGAFYTPREIVHFMCQESLIRHLDSEINSKEQRVEKKDIEKFIREGYLTLERDQAREEGLLHDNKYDLPQSIRTHVKEIDFILANVKVCDPAIGSGAFPVGMMNEIVQARIVLNPFLDDNPVRNSYNFKWNCIENCLYGVDIDPSAIEIAKLRLWLSLVVDEDSYDQIRPLPNLDYRIVCGNSLLGVDEKDKFFQWKNIHTLENKKVQYFSTTNGRNKRILREEIDILINQLTNGKELFDFEVYFSEVFSTQKGFDIILANPPYLGEKGYKDLFREIKKNNLGVFYLGKMDILYFFFHLAINLCKENGIVSFITTNYYPTATGAKKLRKDFKYRTTIMKLVNFNELKIFESAQGQHNMITILSKAINNEALTNISIIKREGMASNELLNQILQGDDKETIYNEVKQNDLYDGQEYYIRLSGEPGLSDDLLHGILSKIKKQGISLGNIANINQGIVSGCDYVSNRNIGKLKKNLEIMLNDGIFVFNLENSRDVKIVKSFNSEERKFLKPFFKNSDIQKYWAKAKPSKLLLYTGKAFNNIEPYPNIRKHLMKFQDILCNRREVINGRIDYYNLQWPRNESLFISDKIVVPYRSDTNSFAYNDSDWFCRSDSYVITKKDNELSLKYILSILNSKLYYLWFYHRGKRKGEILELFQVPLSEVPIKKVTFDEQQPFIELVDEILDITNSDAYPKNQEDHKKVKVFEDKIDKLVYKLYGLNEDEITLVETSVGR